MTDTTIFDSAFTELVAAMVINRRELTVKVVGGMSITAVIKPHPDDVGLLIGRGGATLNALRHVADAMGKQLTGTPCRVEMDCADGSQAQTRQFKRDENWDVVPFQNLITTTCNAVFNCRINLALARLSPKLLKVECYVTNLSDWRSRQGLISGLGWCFGAVSTIQGGPKVQFEVGEMD